MSLGTKKLIWVLDDDQNSMDRYQEFFQGYIFRFFYSLESFTNVVLEKDREQPTLLIINYTFNGTDVVAWLRDNNIVASFNFPFIVVSGHDDLNSFKTAFDNGAMDFILKPLKRNEIVAKVEKAIIQDRNQTLSAKEMVLDGSKVSNLTSKQSQMLSLFMRSPSRSISRDDILEKVWGTTNVHPKTVDVHLYNLRRKLNQHGFIIRSEGGGSWTLLSERINSH